MQPELIYYGYTGYDFSKYTKEEIDIFSKKVFKEIEDKKKIYNIDKFVISVSKNMKFIFDEIEYKIINKQIDTNKKSNDVININGKDFHFFDCENTRYLIPIEDKPIKIYFDDFVKLEV